jgi:hypothetical protein
MCLRFKFCALQRVCVLNFLKKSQIRCTYPTVPVDYEQLLFTGAATQYVFMNQRVPWEQARATCANYGKVNYSILHHTWTN